MKKYGLSVWIILLSIDLSAQNQIWVKVNQGTALYYDPVSSTWAPVSEKQQIPLKTNLMTKENTRLQIFKETQIYDVPNRAYFFVEDILEHNRNELVGSITQIEALDLPPSQKDKKNLNTSIGLTYGDPNYKDTSSVNIPYLAERMHAIQWFYEQKRYDAALLSMKRLLSKFPNQYFFEKNVQILFELYEKLEMYGFLFDESNRLLALQNTGEFGTIVRRWNESAKKRLTNR